MTAKALRATPLALLPGGRVITLGEGCVAQLVDLTEEDKAAKGLRRAAPGEAPPPPMHLTALELVAEQPLLLLTAPPGGGKTMLARRLALHLAGLPVLAGEVPRNALGTRRAEAWHGPLPRPLLLEGVAPETLPGPGTLLILDAAERLGAEGPTLLERLAAAGARALLLGAEDPCAAWPLPAGARRHRLLPFLPAQRAAWAERLGRPGLDLPAHPGLAGLALALDPPASGAEAIADRFLAEAPRAPAALRDQPFLQDLAMARDLAATGAPLPEDPARRAGVLPSLLRRLGPAAPSLAAALLASDAPMAEADALLVADWGGPAPPGLRERLAGIVAAGRLALPLRAAAGRHLARLGDPRDLEELVAVPGGEATLGAAAHPNSAPVHRAVLAPFRIGRFPVTNRLYARFVAATGRAWRSPRGREPERANHPATDLTWHDARACCAWLTATWRAEGRIAAVEAVRLPTEREWEWAARGAQPDAGTAQVYSWAGPWAADRCNSEEAGLNDSCAVGLFPAGRSPFGCDDMAGQVWEWCNTLWGEDMAAPAFRYPWRDDGREDPEAGPRIRRVLRGGSFASGREKTNATYRGSLEPDGFWRGNGFRVVVARG